MNSINRYGYGENDGRALVYVHGAGMDSTVWVNQARYFAARGYNVLGVDLPGHGTNRDDPLLSIEEMANWLVALLKKSGIETAVLVGHSMGALVALEASATRSRDCLILLGAADSMPVHPALLSAAKDDLPTAAAMIAEWGFAAGTINRRQALPSTSLSWASRRLLERSQPGVLASDLLACANYSNAGARAAKIEMLTVIAGDKDRMTPLSGAKKLAGDRADALRVISSAGHMLPLEAPAEVRRIIAAAA